MNQIQDTIKTLWEESDEKLQKATALEEQATAIQRNATELRDKADTKLREVQNEKLEAERISNEYRAESGRKEDELKNRETTLAAKQADLERQTTEKTKLLDTRENEQSIRTSDLLKREAACKVKEEDLDKRRGRYGSIVDFIQKSL